MRYAVFSLTLTALFLKREEEARYIQSFRLKRKDIHTKEGMVPNAHPTKKRGEIERRLTYETTRYRPTATRRAGRRMDRRGGRESQI